MKLEMQAEMVRSIITMASVIEARDPYTGGHTWRVSQYAKKLANAIGFGPEGLFIVHLGGLVHDLGKVGISDSILRKPDKLSDGEYDIMKQHPMIGNDLIARHPYYEILRDAVLNHHERFDGKGYPNAQDRHDMTPIAKVMAIADAFDAMTSTRAYRAGMSIERAMRILEEEKDRQFDGKLVEAFIQLGVNGQLDHILGHSSDERLLLNCPGCGPVVSVQSGADDGNEVHCPVCQGKYVLHKEGNQFEMEFTGEITKTLVPQADLDTVESFMREVPKNIDFSDYINPNYKPKRVLAVPVSSRTQAPQRG